MGEREGGGSSQPEAGSHTCTPKGREQEGFHGGVLTCITRPRTPHRPPSQKALSLHPLCLQPSHPSGVCSECVSYRKPSLRPLSFSSSSWVCVQGHVFPPGTPGVSHLCIPVSLSQGRAQRGSVVVLEHGGGCSPQEHPWGLGAPAWGTCLPPCKFGELLPAAHHSGWWG